jgi:rare lipoprotein A
MMTTHRPAAAFRSATTLALALAVLLVAGCATRAPTPPLEAPQPVPRLDPMQVPDALPMLEPIRAGGPNKPYEVLGESYVPLPADAPLSESGLASWYGGKFHGRRTASGETYDMYAMTAAHPTLPLPSFARVTNPANGRSVIVRVNDRGPFVKGRVIDLSYAAARKLGVAGLTMVKVERITPDEIRTGAWQRNTPPIDGDEPPAVAAAVEAVPASAAVPVAATASEGGSAPAVATRGFWIQLGAYRDSRGAQQMQQQASDAVEDLAPMLTVFADRTVHRVQAGPFASRDEAQRAAERVRERMLLKPVVVERR